MYEYALLQYECYNDQNAPLMIGAFLEMVKNKTISLKELNNLKVKEYEPESDWKHYPPCIQKMIMDKWSGSHRNDLLYNVGVLEMKKADGNINAKDMSDILQKRNQELFVTPMDPKEVEGTVVKSVVKKSCSLHLIPSN